MEAHSSFDLVVEGLDVELISYCKKFLSANLDLSNRKQIMEHLIALSKINIDNDYGGPFAALICDDSGNIISIAVNRVIQTNDPTAHAEVLAIRKACAFIKSYSLADLGNYHLFSSSQPCAMCASALIWAGLSSVTYSASCEDVEQIGFDEGPQHSSIHSEWKKRGIIIYPEIEREKAKAVLMEYKSKGKIYNG